MKTSMKLTAPLLQMILTGTIAVLILATALGMWFFQQRLTDFASEVNKDNVAAVSSQQDISKLEQLKGQMDKDQTAVTRAKAIVADSHYYQYQNQIIDDLRAYATASGFTISGFTFASSPTAGAAGANAVKPVAATQAASATPAPAGLKTTLATITFPKSLPYPVIMKFLKSIEENLTKMEVEGVSLSVDPSSNLIMPAPLTIGVYIK